MRISRWVIVGLLLMGGLTAGAAAAQIEGDPERGGKLYVENCAVCHGVDGNGRVGATLTAFSGIDIDAALTQVITSGIEGAVMPAWGEAGGGPLSDQDIADIVAYITSAFGGTEPIEPLPEYQPPEIAPLPNVEGDPSRGAVVFQVNCVMCHGERGEGRIGAPLAKAWASNQPEVFIRQVVGEGISGSLMPAWAQSNGGPLSDEELDDVTAFMLTLDPRQPAPSPAPPPEGPLTRSTSLLLLGGAALLVVVVIVVYYRRA